MRSDQVPQSAVDVAWSGVDAHRVWGLSQRNVRDVLAAAAPHLIDDAMIERAATALIGGMTARGEIEDEAVTALAILRAALGEVDGDGR